MAGQPGDRLADDAKLVADVGLWIGEQVLGPVGEAIVAAAPVTVRVEVPAGSELVAYRPLELGWVACRPLAVHQVSLVLVPSHARAQTKTPVSERLRMLAVFSLPVDASALNLRRERFQLARNIQRIAETQGKAVELRVLQYGVTRQQLDRIDDQLPGCRLRGGQWPSS